MAAKSTSLDEKEYLVEAAKGTRVLLLEPVHDGVRIIPAETIIQWFSDTPPRRTAARLLEDASPTPLEAPPMTSGKPEAGQIDPVTGVPYVLPPKGQT